GLASGEPLLVAPADHRDPAGPAGVLGVGVRPGVRPGPADLPDPGLGGLSGALQGLLPDHPGLHSPPRRKGGCGHRSGGATLIRGSFARRRRSRRGRPPCSPKGCRPAARWRSTFSRIGSLVTATRGGGRWWLDLAGGLHAPTVAAARAG